MSWAEVKKINKDIVKEFNNKITFLETEIRDLKSKTSEILTRGTVKSVQRGQYSYSTYGMWYRDREDLNRNGFYIRVGFSKPVDTSKTFLSLEWKSDTKYRILLNTGGLSSEKISFNSNEQYTFKFEWQIVEFY